MTSSRPLPTPGGSNTRRITRGQTKAARSRGKPSPGPASNLVNPKARAMNLKTQSSRLLDLPAELRLMIYRHLLRRPENAAMPASSKNPQLGLDLAILRACRQTFDEGSDVLYSENVWQIQRAEQSVRVHKSIDARRGIHGSARPFLEKPLLLAKPLLLENRRVRRIELDIKIGVKFHSSRSRMDAFRREVQDIVSKTKQEVPNIRYFKLRCPVVTEETSKPPWGEGGLPDWEELIRGRWFQRPAGWRDWTGKHEPGSDTHLVKFQIARIVSTYVGSLRGVGEVVFDDSFPRALADRMRNEMRSEAEDTPDGRLGRMFNRLDAVFKRREGPGYYYGDMGDYRLMSKARLAMEAGDEAAFRSFGEKVLGGESQKWEKIRRATEESSANVFTDDAQ
ncbi:hypothetical protein QBC44DRAFT_312677 [Cladorrhinum sp. PSN332]|nr:hypothetical protein QBC44DRAFT_312677 [Cladorrhinum sp. PSN332]